MNSNDSIITCPTCKTPIPLSETIAAPIIAQAKAESAQKIESIQKHFAEKENQLESDRKNLDKLISSRLQEELKQAETKLRIQIKEQVETELEGANLKATEAITRLKELQREKIESDRAQLAAELRAEEAELSAQKTLQMKIKEITNQANRDAEDATRLKVQELEAQKSKLLQQLQEAKRQAEQGSQQAQGEILEIDLENQLKSAFAWDEIEPIKSGTRGGDVVHRIMTGPGNHAGTIMYEIKRTLNWSNDWPTKAKQDALKVKAEITVIVTEATPKGIETFGYYEGVWICKPSFAIPIAQAMRQQIETVANTRRIVLGKQDKAELIYDYLTGPEFRARFEGIVEPFIAMQKDLESEKRATITRWNKREKQIGRILESCSAMFGDLQGIGGQEIPTIAAFSDSEEAEEECSENATI